MIRKTLLTLGLLAVFMLSACTPTASVPTPASEGETPAAASPTAEPALAQEELPTAVPVPVEEPTATEPATETPVEEPLGIPTSRGNQLVATDPNSVNLTNGEPQLIEFFAFW